MLHLRLQDIHVDAQAESQESAVRQVVAALEHSGVITGSYAAALLKRERKISACLGCGVAIVHGAIDPHGGVIQSGVQVFRYAQNIDWSTGQRVWLVIGIAADAAGHLAILSHLGHLLCDKARVRLVKNAKSAPALMEALMAPLDERSLILDRCTLALNAPTGDLAALQRLNAGMLYATGSVDSAYRQACMQQPPLYLSEGVWLSDCAEGNNRSAVAVARPIAPFEQNGKPVALLVSIVVADDEPLHVLNRLSDLLGEGQAEKLQRADEPAMIALLTGDGAENGHVADFIIRNEYGLHARPGTMLVNTIKQFKSEITVANLDGTGKAVNGRSLMKIVALGVKKGHRLRVNARGEDAELALQHIGDAIASGLGETLP